MRIDLLLAFLAGVLSLATACYLFWRKAGSPPMQP